MGASSVDQSVAEAATAAVVSFVKFGWSHPCLPRSSGCPLHQDQLFTLRQWKMCWRCLYDWLRILLASWHSKNWLLVSSNTTPHGKSSVWKSGARAALPRCLMKWLHRWGLKVRPLVVLLMNFQTTTKVIPKKEVWISFVLNGWYIGIPMTMALFVVEDSALVRHRMLRLTAAIWLEIARF